MTTPAQRATLDQLMRYLSSHKAQVHYPPHDERTHRASEIQTEPELREAVIKGRFMYDCSQTVEILCVVAGLHWPRSMVNGYIGSMLARLPHYKRPVNAMPGALCVVGPGTGEHVWMVQEQGSDPLLWGNGAESGPSRIRYAQEARRPRVFLSIAGL